jgi:tetratricopeptide (TPR) repeat protein
MLRAPLHSSAAYRLAAGFIVCWGGCSRTPAEGPIADNLTASGRGAASSASAAPVTPIAPATIEQTKAGSRFLDAGDYEQAVEQFTLAIESAGANVQPVVVDNASAALYRNRGMAYLAMGFPNTAKEDFTDSIALAPADSSGYEQRAVAYQRLGDLFNAIRDATHAIRLKPHNAAAYYTRGLVYLQRQQFELAVPDLEQAQAEDPALAAVVTPQLGEAYYRWSEQLDRDRKHAAAAEKMAIANRLAPDFVRRQVALAATPETVDVTVIERTVAKPVVIEADVHFARGVELQQRGEYDQAIIEFTESIALDRDQQIAYLRRGETLLAMGFPDTALADFQSAEARGGATAEIHRLQARTFLELESPHRAAMSATDALHDNPTDAAMYALRGEAYLRMENWDRAIADLEEAIRRDPKLGPSVEPSLAAAQKGREEAKAKRMQTAYASPLEE